MSGKAAKIQLTVTMFKILSQIASSQNLGIVIVVRAKMILRAFEKEDNQMIASKIQRCAKTVGLWRRRWRDSYQALLQLQFQLSKAAFRRTIIEALSDAPRSGSPGTFSAEQIVGIIAIACEAPELSGRPVTSWTGTELADEAQKRGLVKSISASHVNRILRQVNLKPHKSQYWCNTTEKDPVLFQQQVETVCQTYQEAPALYAQENTHTVCVDEMTSLQANERRAETKRSRPGQIAKEEFQYTRHGTVCVTGNWHVVQGKLIATTISETRNNHDFSQHIKQTIATNSKAGWVFVVDNLNTHYGEPLVRMVAEYLGIDSESLGKVKRQGILKSMESRRKFLSDVSHRIRFVYIPKHSSWLNQIEMIFGMINRRVMRGGSFTSKQDLTEKLRAFFTYFNTHIGRPMTWTYTGRPSSQPISEQPQTWRQLRRVKKQWQEHYLVGNHL